MRGLISTAELAGSVESGDVVLLDVRWRLAGKPGREDYTEAHLPGAVFLDVDTTLAEPPDPALGRHPLPDPERLVVSLRVAGVRTGKPVVVYDDGDGSVAARAWWLLRWLDHREVAVLDGGFAAWHAEGRPLTTEVPSPEPGDFEGEPGAMPVVDAEGAAELAAAGVLLDARAWPRYAGETEPVDPRPGHIPGARNSPFARHTGQDGHWRPAEELAAHFAELGVADEPVGVYCGSGVTACSVVLAMEVAGMGIPALYAGSYSQWSADPRRAVQVGP